MSDRTGSPIIVRRPAWLDEFRAFIMRGNVVDLAVGIIIGVAFTAVVNSLVKDIFTPIIGLAVGGIDFTNIFVTLKGPSEPTLADAQKAGTVTLNIGRLPQRRDPVPDRQLCGLLADQGADAAACAGGGGTGRAAADGGAARGNQGPAGG
jgi:Large-conductance mechanosensitive channel, MscL